MELIAASKLGGDEFLALRHLVAAALERGETLHPVVTEWLTSYLRGEIVEPKTAGRPKRESTAIDGAIRRAVETLVAKGMTATRSDTSPHTSACDAVAKAMLELGLTPSSYGQVARIWGKRAPRLTVEIEEDLSETPKE